MTHDHPAVGLDALVLGIEGMKFFDGNANQQNWLMVFQHVCILDDAVGVEDDLHVDRFARIRRDVHHVLTLEHITEQGFP